MKQLYFQLFRIIIIHIILLVSPSPAYSDKLAAVENPSNEISQYKITVGITPMKITAPTFYCIINADSPKYFDVREFVDALIGDSTILGIFVGCGDNLEENDIYAIAIRNEYMWKQFSNPLSEWLPVIARGFSMIKKKDILVFQDKYAAYASGFNKMFIDSDSIEIQTGITMILGKPLVFYRANFNKTEYVKRTITKLSEWIKTIHGLNALQSK